MPIKKSPKAYNTRSQLIFLVLPHGEVIRLTTFQLLERQIHVVLKGLIVLAYLHGVDELDERGKVLFLLRGFVMDVADKRRVEQRLGFLPEVVPGFPVPLGIGDEGRNQLQNVLLTVDIRKGVVVVGLLEVDGIEYLHLIPIAEHELSALHGDAAFGKSSTNTELFGRTSFSTFECRKPTS